MDKQYRARLEQYLASMVQFKVMREKKVLTADDYKKIETVIARKYGFENKNLYRGIDLIFDEYREMNDTSYRQKKSFLL